MRLGLSSEIVGTIVEISYRDDITILKFSILKEIELPSGAVQEQKLKSVIGRRIGIFNINGEYKIREIQRKL